MKGDNKNQLDMRAALGNDATEAQTREDVLFEMQMNLNNTSDQDMLAERFQPENKKDRDMVAEAQHLMSKSGSDNPYYHTEEGEAEYTQLADERDEYRRLMYEKYLRKKNKKWWQFWI